MSTPRNKKLPLVLAAAVLLGGAGLAYKIWWAPGDEDDEAVFHGNVDIRDVTLAFRVSGRVHEVKKTEGDPVKTSEVIARLDDGPYRAALRQAKAAADGARAKLERVVAGSRRQDIVEARANLGERRARLERAEDTLHRYENLGESGAVTEQALLDAHATAEQAHASVKAARASLRRLIEGSREEDIAVARAQLAQAEAAVAAAEINLADTELRASTAGIVVTRAIEPGAIVQAGTPALVVAFNDPAWIRAFAAEPELARLAPGTPVEVFTDGRDAPYRGQIGYVATQAEFTPKNVETAELRTTLVYRFRVVVNQHDGQLRQGMPVTVRLAAPGDSHEPRETHAERNGR